ncbi:sigma-70 family RNA polymerase sigma factor [Herbivorax sp. ANBcel31]|uniref:RNA polymerase sigma factor n=1 Tax=Herbivorax sp. ANBcel31 TaxID=3069754 RepID=UPI0027B2C2F8|nr:sigma-70 family RNA polymerase sigma factor [Herbivorax sp. ANBcel31]MDQ2085267.1 sigma-70 family RNA polymerase sigma factor [Herbivorax sp. ANBcel31]
MSEKELIEQAKSGSIEAFEQLIEKCQKKVFNIAFKMMGNYEDASELAQEAFIKAYKSIKKFKGDSLFSTWIYRITTNVCLDELRKRKNKKVISLDEYIKYDGEEIKRQVKDESPGPEKVFEKREIKNIMKKCIDSLPIEYKTVVVLRDIQGFSYEEIAKIIKCPEGTVKSRINRARKALKDILKNNKELLNEEYVK